jgi:ankyrin repeat protein
MDDATPPIALADGDDDATGLNSRLLAAVIDGDEDAVAALIATGASADAAAHDGQWPALHLAIEFDHPAIVVRLLEAGATINPTSRRFRTPLQHAVEVEVALLRLDPDGPRDLRLIQPLLDAGADPLAVSKERPETPLELASAADHDDAIRAMQHR